jgi:exportin-2 (importin alpha re-exporter)
MLALSNPQDKTIRSQVAEAVSLIAGLDFPAKWPDLIDVRKYAHFLFPVGYSILKNQQLVASLSPTEYNINIGVLQTAHSIFRQWRAHVRSDELFTEINLVLKTFMTPFLQLFRQTADLLLTVIDVDPANYALLAQCQVLLVDLFYDLSCQDLPPQLEDAHEEFFSSTGGWFRRFLPWDPPQLRGDVRFLPLFLLPIC